MNIRDFIMKFNVLYVRNKMVNHISLRDGPKTTMQSADFFPISQLFLEENLQNTFKHGKML